ncbi:YeiH family protein [Bradyrhizobium sp. SYSU BS000235]|uniref:YeiH family protein n=1 Tax=Bradyrhizobium sp. SYSU BS000235 TaxID=3411332 RepID=UPI003C74F153
MLHRVIAATDKTRKTLIEAGLERAPGIILCLGISVIALGIQSVEAAKFGHPYVEGLVVAILLGMIVRTFWQPGKRWLVGIAFCAKQMLEVAVVLLGASLSFAAIGASGPLLLATVVMTVVVALAFSFGVSRVLGLSTKMSILIACGNSICGNSAIAAVAPVIGANSDDVGAAISFTAILGVLTVLGLPLLVPIFGLSSSQYGILAGLTVYAVPQVLAATVPLGIVSTQVGTLVKLLRVLLLGPVVIGLSLLSHKIQGKEAATGGKRGPMTWVPWFIPGFILFAILRSFDVIPTMAVGPLATIATILTVVSMAALGLGVDVRVIGRVGGRVTAAVTMSLVVLIVISLALIRLF